MSGCRTPQQYLWEVRELCQAHGLSFIEVQDKMGEHYITAYILYRKGLNGGPGIRVGKRRDAADLLRLVKATAGIRESTEPSTVQ